MVNLGHASCWMCSLFQSYLKATEDGKIVEFHASGCQIFSARKKLIAVASKTGSLYYLDCLAHAEQVSVAEQETEEKIWHRRFGHLGIQNLQQLA